jgi:hypothetical protein
MNLNVKKLENIIDELVDATPQMIGNSTSVCIGKVRGRFIKIEVMSSKFAKEEDMEVVDIYDCIESVGKP